LTAYMLLAHKKPAVQRLAVFNAVILIVHGCVFLYRTAMFLGGETVPDFFKSSFFNNLPYLDALVVSLLWTFGFIIMLNQKLNAELKEDKTNLELIFNTSPDAVLITGLYDGNLVEVNEGFTALTGFSRSEVLGKSTAQINLWKHPEDRQRIVDELRERGFCENMEVIFQRKDSMPLFCILSAKLITLQGQLHIISVTRDISSRKKSEDRIKSLLAEKELILKEVHHRIKNNMNTIKGLLSLQADTLTDAGAIAALNDAESRVQSMAMLYDNLYLSEDFTETSLDKYLPSLIDEIVSNFPNASSVKIEKSVEPVILNIKILQPLGIIINELLTNIMKYAFTGRNDGIIRVNVSLNADMVSLVVADNGNGMPASVDFENTAGFGLVLVKGLTQQLKGTIRIERGLGTRIVLEFPFRSSRV